MIDNVLVRGAPSSGKTTYAKTHFPNHIIIQADQFFMIGDDYVYDHGKISAAHDWCLWRCKNAKRPFVVCNTFSRYWEMKPYLLVWPNIKILRMTGEYQNVHGVPDDKVAAIRRRMEPILGETFI